MVRNERQKQLRGIFLGLALCLVVAATAQAARIVVRGISVQLPGIDRYGNIDFSNTGSGHLKLHFNTKNGNFAATGYGKVPNRSKRPQHFRNRIVPTVASIANGMSLDPDEVRIRRDLYCVSRKGRAKAVLAGRYLGDPSNLL